MDNLFEAVAILAHALAVECVRELFDLILLVRGRVLARVWTIALLAVCGAHVLAIVRHDDCFVHALERALSLTAAHVAGAVVVTLLTGSPWVLIRLLDLLPVSLDTRRFILRRAVKVAV